MRKAARAYKTSLAIIAYYGWRLRLADRWHDLGVNSEDEYREKLDIPRSTFFKWVNIGKVHHNLSLADLQAIPTTNLELLQEVAPEQRAEFPWVEEAKTLRPELLVDLIKERHRENGNTYEPMTYFRERVVYSAKKFIEEALEGYKERYGLGSRGRALELMIADNHDRMSALGIINKALNLFEEIQMLLKEKGILDMELLEYIDMGRREIDEAYTSAIEAALMGKRNPHRYSNRPTHYPEERSGASELQEPPMAPMEDPSGDMS